jgi:hypothetical protein
MRIEHCNIIADSIIRKKIMIEENPVVLLSEGQWHIVESSHGSTRAFCGREIRERRAHSRLKTVGRDHLCQECLLLFDDELKSNGES